LKFATDDARQKAKSYLQRLINAHAGAGQALTSRDKPEDLQRPAAKRSRFDEFQDSDDESADGVSELETYLALRLPKGGILKCT